MKNSNASLSFSIKRLSITSAVLAAALSLPAYAQSLDALTHINLVERDKVTIDSQLANLEDHMSNAAADAQAALHGEREKLEASFENARQALEIAIGNAYLARDDAERFQEWAEGRLSDTELAQSNATAEANAVYRYANRAEQAVVDGDFDLAGEIMLLQSAAASSESGASLAGSGAASASSDATRAALRSDEALAWRNRAEEAFQSAQDDANLADTAKRAAEAARHAASTARDAAQTARDSAQDLTGSASALRILLIDRANQAADDANRIADDVEGASQRYQAVSTLLSTVQGRHNSYLSRLIWAENNIPETCITCDTPTHIGQQSSNFCGHEGIHLIYAGVSGGRQLLIDRHNIAPVGASTNPSWHGCFSHGDGRWLLGSVSEYSTIRNNIRPLGIVNFSNNDHWTRTGSAPTYQLYSFRTGNSQSNRFPGLRDVKCIRYF